MRERHGGDAFRQGGGLPVTVMQHKKVAQFEVFQGRVHRRRDSGTGTQLDLEPQPLPPPDHEQVQLGTRVQGPGERLIPFRSQNLQGS